jgi:GT2 family glycosyltransferase
MTPLSVSVVIATYTRDRWPALVRAVESVRRQTVAPDEIVISVDNNNELLALTHAHWHDAAEPPVRALANPFADRLDASRAQAKAHGVARRFSGGSARNAAAESIASEVIAFLDDDAWAEPDWLERLLRVYEWFRVVAVGGAPLPEYETERPVWFPGAFNWVFGCAYEGLPQSTGPLRHLIGANLSVRRDAFQALHGFRSVDFDDLDLCMRVVDRFGTASLYFEPRAVVHHYVPAERVSWQYFYRRCYVVNREKVRTFREMGSAANLIAEREFVRRALTRDFVAYVRRGLAGEPGSFRAAGATIAGVTLAVIGHVRGRLDGILSSSAERRRLPACPDQP